jgi:ligand-binding sensor domain-containing protein
MLLVFNIDCFKLKMSKKYHTLLINASTQKWPHIWINCILKDSKGFMWFGTLSGLNKYDSYKFKIFNIRRDTVSLIDDLIVSINEEPDDKL